MKYNGFYFWLFKRPMKKVLIEKYGKSYASDIIRKSKGVYRDLVENMDDIGADTVSYTHLTLPTTARRCRSRWSPYH